MTENTLFIDGFQAKRKMENVWRPTSRVTKGYELCLF